MMIVRMGLVIVTACLAACAAAPTESGPTVARPALSYAQAAFEQGVQAEAAGSGLADRRRALARYRAAAGRSSLDIFVTGVGLGRPTVRRVAVARDGTYWAARAAAARLIIEANGDLGSVREACRGARQVVAAPISNDEVTNLRRIWSSACLQGNGEGS